MTKNDTCTSLLFADLSIFASRRVHTGVQEALKMPLTGFMLPGYAPINRLLVAY